jgi:hypothetical protein
LDETTGAATDAAQYGQTCHDGWSGAAHSGHGCFSLVVQTGHTW